MQVRTQSARRGQIVRGIVRVPWGATAWLNTFQVASGMPLALVAMVVVLSLGAVTVSLVITAVLAVPFLWALFRGAHRFTRWQRVRIRGVYGVSIAASDERPDEDTWLRRLNAQARIPGTWRQVAYHLLSGVTSMISCVVVLGLWAGGVTFAASGLWLRDLPNGDLLGYSPHSPAILVGLTMLGLVAIFLAPWAAVVAAHLDLSLATAMLSPSRSEQLARRVVTLTESRIDAIHAADSERRRIERDLHDGTQQRLVSLAMNLGIARTTLTDVPPQAREAIERAHDDAKQAVSELREVVRGMHPAILDDLGLDAALSGIAARSPVPVRLVSTLPRRLPGAVESVGYFVVSEALTNVAKHAEAAQIDVSVELVDDVLLRITVRDDGRGGANPSSGSGLRGLEQRVRSVDGTIAIASPAGGPTIIVVELPCAS